MFTGIIQALGSVRRTSRGVLVEGCGPFSPIGLGDSIAVDGVCLTVAEIVPGGFIADVSEETLRRTTLGLKAARADDVNLEPALRFSDRLGGHLVSGHVDGLGEVVAIEELPHSWKIEVLCRNRDLNRFICEKGSISLNGISLTIAGIWAEESRFWIAVIPHTWSITSLKNLAVGSLVNIEVDLLAKYLERLSIKAKYKELSPPNSRDLSSDISPHWLKEHGWN